MFCVNPGDQDPLVARHRCQLRAPECRQGLVLGRLHSGGRDCLGQAVVGIPEAFALAEACVEHGSWGGAVECFVLVMALCGLRPGEAAGLLWEDLELPDDGTAGWVTVRRTHRPVAARWLDAGEDPEWGPLKDRDVADSRGAPVHPTLVTKLLAHREAYGAGDDGLVFHRHGKPFDPDMFDRNVWRPGRAALWPLRIGIRSDDPRQPKLARLRRHDLRHAACSWWLRERASTPSCANAGPATRPSPSSSTSTKGRSGPRGRGSPQACLQLLGRSPHKHGSAVVHAIVIAHLRSRCRQAAEPKIAPH